MATADYSLANQSGASFRTDLNNTLSAIATNNSNSSDPSTTFASQYFADTSASIMKLRNTRITHMLTYLLLQVAQLFLLMEQLTL